MSWFSWMDYQMTDATVDPVPAAGQIEQSEKSISFAMETVFPRKSSTKQLYDAAMS
jgi:hypothetical protein